MKRRIYLPTIAALSLLMASAPLEAMTWQPAAAKPATSLSNHGMRHKPARFQLQGGEGAAIRLLLPDLSSRTLKADADGTATIKATGMEYFHALVAERQSIGRQEAAIRYLHLFGKPSGHSPTELLAMPHTKLDIVPAPLPREHWSYMAGHSFTFIVRFDGLPLARQQFMLQTSHGSRQQLVTDAKGRIAITLPDDFGQVMPGRRHNRPAEFRLACDYRHEGITYSTTLSAPYRADPRHWQSLQLGIATTAGGMLLGGLLTFRNLRRKEK
jgi:hypothetical protein